MCVCMCVCPWNWSMSHACACVTSWHQTGLNDSTHNPSANLCFRHRVCAMRRSTLSPCVFRGGDLNASCDRRPSSDDGDTASVNLLSWTGHQKVWVEKQKYPFQNQHRAFCGLYTLWFSWKTLTHICWCWEFYKNRIQAGLTTHTESV